MKKIQKIVMTILIVLSQFSWMPVKAATTEIYTKEDLNNIRRNSSGSYVLMNDIIFEASDFLAGGLFYNHGKGWTPITRFSGTLDGNGHVISGLTIKDQNLKNVGFISENTGSIKNLGFTDVSISGMHVSNYQTFNYQDSLGTIAGLNQGYITNCFVTGKIDSKSEMTGGLVGINRRSITDSYNEASVHSGVYDDESHTGGIVGHNYSTVRNCYNKGKITITDNDDWIHVGGIVGYNDSSISYCYNVGYIHTSNIKGRETGGVAGHNSGEVTYCYNLGTVDGYYTVGGVVGKNYGYRTTRGIIGYCYNAGSVISYGPEAAGIAANDDCGTIYDCYNTGTISNRGTGVYNCYSAGIVGKIDGENGDGTTDRCYNLGQIHMQATSGRIFSGGIFGYFYGGIANHCYTIESQTLPLWTKKDEVANAKAVGYIAQKDLDKATSYPTFNFDKVWTLDANSSEYRYPTLKNVTLQNTDYILSTSTSHLDTNMKVGETRVYPASVVGTKPHCSRVIYTSSDESIATVNTEGIITALSSGKVVITAIAANNKKQSLTFTVKGLEETEAQIIVDTIECIPNEQKELQIYLKDNPGLTSMRLAVHYDSNLLTLCHVEDMNLLGAFNHSDQLDGNPYYLSWENDTSSTNFTTDGAIVSLYFEVKEDVDFTSTPIFITYDYDQYDIMDKDLNKVYFNIEDGSITCPEVTSIELIKQPTKITYQVGETLDLTDGQLAIHYANGGSINIPLEKAKIEGYDENKLGEQMITVTYKHQKTQFVIEVVETNVLYGDVNQDGRVNQQDRMILTRCIAKWTGYPMNMMDLEAADVNQDGRINQQDRMILTRYIAKWTGYTELPYPSS